MRTLVCGSIAYDNIMVFRGRFREHILPEQIHILNVAFLVPELRREFGGCAGNIAYNLKLLGSDPLVMGTVGDDSLLYFERLERLGIKLDFVRQVPNTLTAQAFITTDLDANQITAFHPGAMNHSHQNNITGELDVDLAIIAPDGREGMLQHARELAELGVPFMFDPGQGLPMFSGEELLAFVEQASYVAVNDFSPGAPRGLSSTPTANGSRSLALRQPKWWIPRVVATRIAPVFFTVLPRASTGPRPAGSQP